MEYSLKEAGMPYQYVLILPLYIAVAPKLDNNHKILIRQIEKSIIFMIYFQMLEL